MVLGLQGRETGGQNVDRERFGAGHAHKSFKPCVVPANAAQHTDNLSLGPFSLGAHTFSSRCQHITIGCTMQKSHAQPPLK